MSIDVVLRQDSESRIALGDDANFDFGCFEIDRQHGGQARDCQLDGLLLAQVGAFLQLLLQVAVCLCLFHTDGDSPETAIVASRIGFVDARTIVVIICYDVSTKLLLFNWKKAFVCVCVCVNIPIKTMLQPSGRISAFCVYTWLMSAMRRHSTSTGISVPYL